MSRINAEVRQAHEYLDTVDESTRKGATLDVARAHVHATLALVEAVERLTDVVRASSNGVAAEVARVAEGVIAGERVVRFAP